MGPAVPERDHQVVVTRQPGVLLTLPQQQAAVFPSVESQLHSFIPGVPRHHATIQLQVTFSREADRVENVESWNVNITTGNIVLFVDCLTGVTVSAPEAPGTVAGVVGAVPRAEPTVLTERRLHITESEGGLTASSSVSLDTLTGDRPVTEVTAQPAVLTGLRLARGGRS